MIVRRGRDGLDGYGNLSNNQFACWPVNEVAEAATLANKGTTYLNKDCDAIGRQNLRKENVALDVGDVV